MMASTIDSGDESFARYAQAPEVMALRMYDGIL